jgi:hypothetical protein
MTIDGFFFFFLMVQSNIERKKETRVGNGEQGEDQEKEKREGFYIIEEWDFQGYECFCFAVKKC